MAKRYDPTTTDLLPKKAQKAFERYSRSMLDAEQRLLNKWLALSDEDWAFTVRKLEEWTSVASPGHPNVDLFRGLIEQINYERREL